MPEIELDTKLCLAQELTFIEFFAGRGAVWRLMRASTNSCTGIDMEYWKDHMPDDGSEDRNPFDILNDHGFPCGPQVLCIYTYDFCFLVIPNHECMQASGA